MKRLTVLLTAVFFAGAAWQAFAASTPTAAPGATSFAGNAADQAKLQKELEQARQKLREDARRLSELTMQLNGPGMDKYVYVYHGGHEAGNHGYLGVGLKETGQGSASSGARIADVTPGGPADKAGLKAGDLITAINGTQFLSKPGNSASDQLMEFMHKVKPGDSLKVSYLRDGKPATVKVVAADLGKVVAIDMGGFMHRPVLGINIDTDAAGSGVKLAGVTPGGPAEKAGLRTGDVLTSINGTELKPQGGKSSGEELLIYMQTVHPGDKLKLDYVRDGKSAVAMVVAANPRDFMFSMHMPQWSGSIPVPPIPPAPPIPPMMPGAFGLMLGGGHWADMQLAPMSPGLGSYFGTDKGLLVLHAPADSALKLRDGDVILKIGNRDPGTPPHAMRILGSYGPGETVPLTIMRMGKHMSINVKLPKEKDSDMDSAILELRRSLDQQLDATTSTD